MEHNAGLCSAWQLHCRTAAARSFVYIHTVCFAAAVQTWSLPLIIISKNEDVLSIYPPMSEWDKDGEKECTDTDIKTLVWCRWESLHGCFKVCFWPRTACITWKISKTPNLLMSCHCSSSYRHSVCSNLFPWRLKWKVRHSATHTYSHKCLTCSFPEWCSMLCVTYFNVVHGIISPSWWGQTITH